MSNTMMYGPLPQLPETRELEKLARAMMENGNFTIETRNDCDYFIFEEGGNTKEFNWTEIRQRANMQHVNLKQEDFAAYASYMERNGNDRSSLKDWVGPGIADGADPTKLCSLREDQLASYRAALDVSEDEMSFQEMQAINIYTGGFYQTMNGLMRDDASRVDYAKAPHHVTRAAVIQSVMCASGLRKLPEQKIKTAYRFASVSEGVQAEHKKAAKSKDVVSLTGFISTSTDLNSLSDNSNFNASDKVQYTFSNLRGMDVSSISQNPKEQEFLMPSTDIQMQSATVNNNGRLCMTAQCVSPVLEATPIETVTQRNQRIAETKVFPVLDETQVKAYFSSMESYLEAHLGELNKIQGASIEAQPYYKFLENIRELLDGNIDEESHNKVITLISLAINEIKTYNLGPGNYNLPEKYNEIANFEPTVDIANQDYSGVLGLVDALSQDSMDKETLGHEEPKLKPSTPVQEATPIGTVTQRNQRIAETKVFPVLDETQVKAYFSSMESYLEAHLGELNKTQGASIEAQPYYKFLENIRELLDGNIDEESHNKVITLISLAINEIKTYNLEPSNYNLPEKYNEIANFEPSGTLLYRDASGMVGLVDALSQDSIVEPQNITPPEAVMPAAPEQASMDKEILGDEGPKLQSSISESISSKLNIKQRLMQIKAHYSAKPDKAQALKLIIEEINDITPERSNTEQIQALEDILNPPSFSLQSSPLIRLGINKDLVAALKTADSTELRNAVEDCLNKLPQHSQKSVEQEEEEEAKVCLNQAIKHIETQGEDCKFLPKQLKYLATSSTKSELETHMARHFSFAKRGLTSQLGKVYGIKRDIIDRFPAEKDGIKRLQEAAQAQALKLVIKEINSITPDTSNKKQMQAVDDFLKSTESSWQSSPLIRLGINKDLVAALKTTDNKELHDAVTNHFFISPNNSTEAVEEKEAEEYNPPSMKR